jgi:hypothetical protein
MPLLHRIVEGVGWLFIGSCVLLAIELWMESRGRVSNDSHARGRFFGGRR